MKYSISKIAGELGLGKTTVSLILNGKNSKYGISNKTVKRVLDFCREKDYSINIHAKRLNQEYSGNIGVIVREFDEEAPSSGNETPLSEYNASKVLGGIASSAIKNDYKFDIMFYSKNLTADSLDGLFRMKEIDGLIFFGFFIPQEWRKMFIAKKRPLVNIWGNPDDGIPTVNVDNCSGISQIVKHLLSRDKRKIIYLTPPVNRGYVALKRLQSAKETAGKSLKEVCFIDKYDERLAYEWARKYFSSNRKNCPDAVMCACDPMGFGVIQALKELKFEIPEDIAVTGANDINISKYITPSLTSFDNQNDAVGKATFDLLLKQIKKKKVTNKNIIIETSISKRAST